MKPESPKPTVRQEAILVAVAVTIAMAVGVLDAMFSPTFAGFKAPRLVIMAVLILGHASWITLDCRRLGRNPGNWWVPAAVLGILTVPVYLIVAYREKAAVYIPLYWGLCALALGAGPFTRWALNGGGPWTF